MRNKHLCVHGHFYQPPRENPWLEIVEPEESAQPYSDWNSRIAAECYAPNAACPVRDDDGRIVAMADNYASMSFNFGPTLLAWLERKRPWLYRHILRADRESAARRGGHGNAVAQPFYHVILPLASRRDKATLVRWGLQDFEHRFGRRAEGMFLPETAVDEETLQVLAEEGLRFTILAQEQVGAVRGPGEDWRELPPRGADPRLPYLWRGDDGAQLALFLFDRGLHNMVVDGEAFTGPISLFDKALGRLSPGDPAELVMMATDGEFFGHHHRHAHAALARAFALAEAAGIRAVNPAQYLELFPPPLEARLRPRTAWSCPHGLGRWTEDCGCRSKHLAHWKQDWRAPLRAALDWLSGELDALYESRAGEVFRDFREAREQYGRVLCGAEAGPEFVAARALGPANPERAAAGLRLLELQRQRLAMFTSCGWFYDEVSGLETQQVLRRAARALELAASFGKDLSGGFKERLAAAPSNVERFGDAAKAYALLIEPSRVDLPRAAARFAILDHFGHGEAAETPVLRFERLGAARRDVPGPAGRDRALSWLRLRARRLDTGESAELECAVFQADRLDLSCWVRPGSGGAAEAALALLGGDDEAVRRAGSRHFGAEAVGLDALLARERLDLTRLLLPSPLMTRELQELMARWSAAVARLRRGEAADEELLDALLRCAQHKLKPDLLPWAELARERFLEVLAALPDGPDAAALSRAARWLSAVEDAGLHVDAWEAQHALWRWKEALERRPARPGESEAVRAWGEKLRFAFAVPAAPPAPPAPAGGNL